MQKSAWDGLRQIWEVCGFPNSAEGKADFSQKGRAAGYSDEEVTEFLADRELFEGMRRSMAEQLRKDPLLDAAVPKKGK